jgi:hypothetical protein
MLSLLRTLDTFVQHHVNAAVLYLIDHGIPKSLTVYALALLSMGAFMAEVVLDGEAVNIIIGGVACLVIGLVIEWKRRDIERAESSPNGTARSHFEGNEFPLWKLFQVGMLVVDPLGESAIYGVVLSVIFWSAALIESYAIASPRRPPRPPERKIVLVPQPSAT